MSKHTPAPWHADGEHIYAGDHLQIATVELYRGQLTEAQEQEDTANAHLLAAAPDLLDALEIIAAGNTDPDQMVEIAREAIAKATGGAA